MTDLRILDPGTGSEAGRSTPIATGARHSFAASPNPRNKDCVRCGRPNTDVIHNHHPLMQQAAVVAALEMAAKSMREDDRVQARIYAVHAVRLMDES
jgi:hypothetical protein